MCMNNIDISGISNIDVVTNLFAQLNCLSNDNCILVVVNRDYNTVSDPGEILRGNATIVGAKNGGVAGGIVGGVVAGAVSNSVNQAVESFNSKLNDKQKIVYSAIYCGFLINITTTGVGIIPLLNDNKLIPKIKDFKTDVANYIFFSNDEIEKVQVEKLPLHFSSKKLAIYFKNLDKICTPWELPKKHKLISYQNDNYNKLINILK